MNTITQVYNEKLHKNGVTTFLINTNYSCNYSCYYCYNQKYLNDTSILNLEKTEKFLVWYYANINKNIDVYLLGGESLFHPNINVFIANISKYSTISVTIITNFSHDIQTIVNLLDKHIKFALTWHSIPKDRYNYEFIDKINNIPYKYFLNNQIKISIMYEKLFYRQSLNAFDLLYDNFKEYIELSLVDANHLDIVPKAYIYSDDEIDEFKKRIVDTKLKYITKNLVLTYIINNQKQTYLQAEALLNTDLINFKNYLCDAGKSVIWIYINGDISPCDDLYVNKHVKIGNIFDKDYSKFKFKPHICSASICTCPVFAAKQKIFNIQK